MSRLITPQGKPSDYKSFTIDAPRSTHWRAATCEEVACVHYLQGWFSEFDTNKEQGREQEAYVRHMSGLAFQQVLERPDGEPLPAGVVRFEFLPGQQCFSAFKHKTRIEDVAEIYSTRTGDYRVNGGAQRVSADGWVNQFLTNDERLKKQREAAS